VLLLAFPNGHTAVGLETRLNADQLITKDFINFFTIQRDRCVIFLYNFANCTAIQQAGKILLKYGSFL
jgi:hypothetical protein